MTGPRPALGQLRPACSDLTHRGLLRAARGEVASPQRNTEQQRALQPAKGQTAGMTHCPLRDFEKTWLQWSVPLLKLPEQEDDANKPTNRNTVGRLPAPGPGGPRDRPPRSSFGIAFRQAAHHLSAKSHLALRTDTTLQRHC